MVKLPFLLLDKWNSSLIDLMIFGLTFLPRVIFLKGVSDFVNLMLKILQWLLIALRMIIQVV